MQHWVDSILAEHEANPIDLLVINGDTSLDYWKDGGSVLTNGTGTTQVWMEKYVSQLRDKMPIFVMPGNHEQYSNKDWCKIVGNCRQGSYVLGDTLFLFMDNYNAGLNPTTHNDGVYTATDVAYINAMMEAFPDKDVYIISHCFDTTSTNASGELVESGLQTLLAGDSTNRIKGLFAGHTHESNLIELGEAWGNKTIAQTGNFAYSNTYSTLQSEEEDLWGFRELFITDDTAYSRYIRVKSSNIVKSSYAPARTYNFERAIYNSITYYPAAE